jgi:nucleotide-binding universal stress UspA family protein
MIDVKKILVPTDFSKFSDKAFQEALEIAETFNSKIYLVYVIRGESGFSIAETFDEETQKKVHRELEKKTEMAFKNQIKKFPLSKKIEIIKKVSKGVPYKEVLEYQKEIDADVIVIAAHGRSGFEEFFFGSTSEKIVRRAECSVLLVK